MTLLMTQDRPSGNTVVVDPTARTARVPAAASWRQVVNAAAAHELIALHAESLEWNATTSLLRGAPSLFERPFGRPVDSIVSLTLVNFSGSSFTLFREDDLAEFHEVAGGSLRLGTISELTMTLHPMQAIVTGTAFWPADQASAVVPLWRSWTKTAPRTVTTRLRLMKIRHQSAIPPVLSTGPVIALEGAITADHRDWLPDAERIAGDLLGPLFRAARPVINTWGPANPSTITATSIPTCVSSQGAVDHMASTDPDSFALVDIFEFAAHDPAVLYLEFHQLGGSGLHTCTSRNFPLSQSPLQYFGVSVPTGPAARDVQSLATIRSLLGPMNRDVRPQHADKLNAPRAQQEEETT